VFAPPDATLVEISSRAILHMDEMRVLAAAAGQAVRRVVSDDVAPAQRSGPRMHSDYRVDLEALRATVAEVLAA
jgi:hypothetical protein